MARLLSPGKGEELGTDRGTCPRPPNKCVNKSDGTFPWGAETPCLQYNPVPPSWENGLSGENGPEFLLMSSLWWWIILLCRRND